MPISYKRQKTKVKVNGKRVEQILVKQTQSNKYFNRNKISAIGYRIRDEIQEDFPNQYQMMITINDINIGWRSGSYGKTDESIKIYGAEDYDLYDLDDKDNLIDKLKVDKFMIYLAPLSKKKTKMGCKNSFNDCVFEALESMGIKEMSKANLKAKLGLRRRQKIPVNMIKDIEEISYYKNYSINVHGATDEESYISNKNDRKFKIYLKNVNGHCVPDKSNFIKDNYNIPSMYINRKFKFFKYNGDKVDLYHIDQKGEHFETMELNDFYVIQNIVKKNPDQHKYVLIPANKKQTIKESYEKFEELRKTFFKLDVDICQWGTTKNIALYYWLSTISHITFEDVDLTEQRWIKEAYMGSIIYANKGYEGKGHSYDKRSFYPYLMKGTKLYPYKKGSFGKITEDEFNNDNVPYGIYRCIITGKHKLFRNNDKNKYTHYDIMSARQLGLKVNLIDSEINCLRYNREDLLTGKQLFGAFVNNLYELRKENDYVKAVLNILSGLLGEKAKININVKDETDLTGHEILRHNPNEDGSEYVQSVDMNKQIFKYPFCRISPFLLGAGRREMCQLIEPYSDLVEHIHTDGFISRKKLEIPTGEKLGEIKYKYSKNIKVFHVNCVKDMETKEKF